MESWLDSGESFIGGPVRPLEAQIAAHDYAHLGFYFRIVRKGDRHWGILLRYGREKLPGCCKNKRTYVTEEPKILWEPRPLAPHIEREVPRTVTIAIKRSSAKKRLRG